MIPFPLLLAWREGRSAVRRIGAHALSISLGVAALVAIHSFREDVGRALDTQSRALLGADVLMGSARPFPDAILAVIDSLEATGSRAARLTNAVSMVSAPASGGVRLAQVRSVDGGWPFYGEPRFEPAGVWDALSEAGTAVVDPAILVQLDLEVGDTLAVGTARLRVAGTVSDLPTEVGFQTAVGPRVWVGPGVLEAAGLIGFGSLVRYELYLRLPDGDDAGALEERYPDLLAGTEVAFTTAEERARAFTRAVDDLGRFLGLVGLGALLLGGLGVGSAVNVFVRERLTEVAVLRCVGARQNALFVAYLLLAAALALAGSVVGAAAGVGVQHLLPRALAGVLPVDVVPTISGSSIAIGLGIGVHVAVLFALLPLLTVRNVPPLRALRHSIEPTSGSRMARLAIAGLIVGVVAALAVTESGDLAVGLLFTVALGVSAALLAATGWVIARWARRLLPAGAPYPLRQGLSNLYRPANQTVGVTLALGFGAFVVGTLLLVESNLTRALRFDVDAANPNLLLFDIQEDQREGVVGLLPPEAREGVEATPLVPSRLASVAGVSTTELEREGEGGPEGWAVRREYRHTWRAELTDAETLVEGVWWDEAPLVDGLARISMEVDLARELGVGVGDTLVWTVAGREIGSVITSLRAVDWDRFQTNFFVVFEPGGLEGAPATWVALVRVDGEDARVAFQRRLVATYPNVSVLDVTRVREVVEGILAQVQRAIRFLGIFAGAAGLAVLAGALATSRRQRLREGALLRTLGARRGQLLAVFFAEFLALGAVATAAGLALAMAAAWLLISRDFGLEYALDAPALAAIAAGVLLLTVVTGLIGSRGLLRRPPLAVLREL